MSMELMATSEQMNIYDKMLCTEALEALHHFYPGWQWAVQAPEGTDMLYVRNYDLSAKFGMRRFKTDLYGRNMRAEMMRAGGEMLERWKQARKWYEDGQTDWHQMLFTKPEM